MAADVRWLSIRDSVKGVHLVVSVVRSDAGGIKGFCCWGAVRYVGVERETCQGSRLKKAVDLHD